MELIQFKRTPLSMRKAEFSLLWVKLLFGKKKKPNTFVFGFWQREKDSNPHKQSQSLSCYPYTIPLFVLAVASTNVIIANNSGKSIGNFEISKNFSTVVFG